MTVFGLLVFFKSFFAKLIVYAVLPGSDWVWFL